MKNKEKYAKEIIEIAKRGHIIAVDKKTSHKKTRCNKPLREHSNIQKRGVKRWNTTMEQH